MAFCRLLIIFRNQLFRKILSGIPSECQTVLVRLDVLLGLIWNQNVCEGFQQTTLAGKELIMKKWKYIMTDLLSVVILLFFFQEHTNLSHDMTKETIGCASREDIDPRQSENFGSFRESSLGCR